MLPRENFCVATTTIHGLGNLKFRAIAAQVLELRRKVLHDEPDWTNEFATLYVDGLSMAEDGLVSAIIPALGNTKLFGGSAGDGMSAHRVAHAATKEGSSSVSLALPVMMTIVPRNCGARGSDSRTMRSKDGFSSNPSRSM